MAVFDFAAVLQLGMNFQEISKTVAQGAKDLASYVHLGSVLRIAADFSRLATQLDSLGSRIVGRGQWWDSVGSITSIDELESFRYDARNVCWAAQREVTTAGNLLRDFNAILATLNDLMNHVQEISGSVAGMQAVQGPLGSMVAGMGSVAGLQGVASEVNICQLNTQTIERDAMGRIGRGLISNWGAYTSPF